VNAGPASGKGWSGRAADAATIAMAAVAVLVAAQYLSERSEAASQPPPFGVEDREIEDWQALAREETRIGSSDAPVQIIEFGDYECPFCRNAEGVLEAVRQAYPTAVSTVYRHLPLSSHRNAYQAARFAECAANQGAFADMHRLLYRVVTLDGLDPGSFVAEVPLTDPERFVSCSRSTDPVPAIEEDLALATELGLAGVPAIILDGVLQATPPDSAALFQYVKERSAR
jgi:protein-disulfide isomerase